MDRLSFAFITIDSISRLSDTVFSDCKQLNMVIWRAICILRQVAFLA